MRQAYSRGVLYLVAKELLFKLAARAGLHATGTASWSATIQLHRLIPMFGRSPDRMSG